MTLLELLVVVTLMAITTTVVLGRYGRTIFGNFGSRAEARTLATAMMAAKRAAIATGHDHLVRFTNSGGRAASYQILQSDGQSLTTVHPAHVFPSDLNVVASHSEMYFTFEGQAKAAYQVQLYGTDRSFQLDVVPISGAVTTTETGRP